MDIRDRNELNNSWTKLRLTALLEATVLHATRSEHRQWAKMRGRSDDVIGIDLGDALVRGPSEALACTEETN